MARCRASARRTGGTPSASATKTPTRTPWPIARCWAWRRWRSGRASTTTPPAIDAAAGKLHDAYFKTFYNPATGVLAGWKSADGKLHDYYFLPVNGIAIHYGLVPKDEANTIIDKLLAKMKEVGYTRFDLGLPGNLIPVLRKTTSTGSALGRRREGGQFRRLPNLRERRGHRLPRLPFPGRPYDLGRRDEADKILFPMLASFEKGSFEGIGANGMSNDWKAWDGTPWGYEGFLTDGYYALLAVLVRDGQIKPPTP